MSNSTVENDVNDVKEMRQEIKELRETVQQLTTVLNKVNKSCENMDSHISFVEYVYSKVVAPLNYIKSSYESYFLTNQSDTLPLPLTKEDVVISNALTE